MTVDPRAWVAAQQARSDAASGGPWFKGEGEGRLQVWREGVLRVRRDEQGEVRTWSAPGSYAPEDLIYEKDLDSWDPGVDEQDDQMRVDAAFIVHARTALPSALAALSAVLDECDRLAALCPPGDWPADGVAAMDAVSAAAVADAARHLRALVAQHLPADVDRG